MNVFLRTSLVGFVLVSASVNAEGYGPYNQQYTMNQNYGVSNWMTAFGPGINTAGVAIISGLVNAMSRPDPVVVVPSQNQYQQQTQQQPYLQQQASNQGNCRMQTLYDQSGNPRYVKVCD